MPVGNDWANGRNNPASQREAGDRAGEGGTAAVSAKKDSGLVKISTVTS